MYMISSVLCREFFHFFQIKAPVTDRTKIKDFSRWRRQKKKNICILWLGPGLRPGPSKKAHLSFAMQSVRHNTCTNSDMTYSNSALFVLSNYENQLIFHSCFCCKTWDIPSSFWCQIPKQNKNKYFYFFWAVSVLVSYPLHVPNRKQRPDSFCIGALNVI